MISTTSERALGAAEELRSKNQGQTSPASGPTKLDAVASRSILGQHDGTLPDDFMELLESASA
jgi:hypothetical protein